LGHPEREPRPNSKLRSVRFCTLALNLPVSYLGAMRLESTLTCPACGHQASMPTDACQFFYDCWACGRRLRPKPGDCCVFCSYGDGALSSHPSWRSLLPVKAARQREPKPAPSLGLGARIAMERESRTSIGPARKSMKSSTHSICNHDSGLLAAAGRTFERSFKCCS
jgi:hypothetical protein